MTMTELAPTPTAVPPVAFRRVVLVGVDEALPPAPVAPVVVPDLAPAPALPADGALGRGRLVASVASVALLLVVVVAMAWFRFSGAAGLPVTAGPLPSVTITTTDPVALSDGAAVEVALGAGVAVERVDVFVDGDWTGSDTTAPYAPEWEHRSAGTHELKAKVTDADGRVRYSDPVEVTIGS
jgi:hypothetical protein